MRYLPAAHYARSVIAVVLATAFFLCGCAKSGYDVHLICADSTGFYWSSLIDGAEQAAADNDVKLSVDVLDGTKTLRELVDAVARVDDSALILALDKNSAFEPISSFIPVVTINCETEIPESAVAEIGGKDYFNGSDLGGAIKRYAGLQIKIILMTAEPKYRPDDLWEGQLRSAVGLGGITFAERICCGNDALEYELRCRAALEKDPDIKAVICQNEYATVGALRALRETNSRAMIFGREINRDIAEGIEDGLIFCTYVTNAYAMGYLGVEAARGDRNGVFAYRNGLEAIYVDKDNLFDEAITKLFFPVDAGE